MTDKTHFLFEDFLKEKHGDQYIGFDDDMPDAFNDWLGELDREEWLEYGGEYGRLIKKMNTNI